MKMMESPSATSSFKHGEEVLGLLRGQNGRRLVEDQDARVPVEGLEDLHPLAYSHREVGDARPRVDLQAVALRELLGRPDGLFHVQGDAQSAAAGLGAEDDVLGHGEGWDQGEVLVDHPDAAG